MTEKNLMLLKGEIEKAELVSFDIFDTLLFRKTNTPETVFDITGRHFGIHGFKKLRMDAQNEASRRVYAQYKYPHADMDDIYAVLSERRDIPVDWNEVKAFEIRLENDALVPSPEMQEIVRFAKSAGKRVVATSDMYLKAATLWDFLKEKGFGGIDHVYCSADEHKAKFNRDLFEVLPEKEKVPYEKILHVGDKERDDGEFPRAYGINTFIVTADADLQKVKDAPGSDVDRGVYKILARESKGFWYNLGVEVGGPLYMGLCRFVREKLNGEKIFFLSRDGYNLWHIFKNRGWGDCEYLCTSRRSLTLAAITEMNSADVESLPPYTLGQTVGEILDYLCVDKNRITGLENAGFSSFEDLIKTEEDRAAFKKLYTLDKALFLKRCEAERENAKRYFESVGFFDGDAVCFDCGWQGSSQELIERFKKAVGCRARHRFLYFGIKNSEKSKLQLRGCHYDAFLFDFYRNHSLQADLHQNVVIYELFFSAPHESLFYYGENGEPVFEDGEGDGFKTEILEGIRDFVDTAWDFSETYGVEHTPELASGHLKRLIAYPTREEAVTIGNVQNVDGFARKSGESKFVAYVTAETLENNPSTEIYWPAGLLARPDVEESVKKACAAARGIAYPPLENPYHLEDEYSLRAYRRWMEYEKAHREPEKSLEYRPFFSVVIPVYNTVTPQLRECFASVLSQTYGDFELILVDDCSTWENVVPVLRETAADPHVRVIYRAQNGHISAATNDGIAAAKGEFIVFMDCDDVIEPDTLYRFAEKLNENPELDFIYSDEDKLSEDGLIRHQPFFKPEWSPDLFMNMMYTNHLAVYRASIVKAVGGLRTAYNGSQDYDFTLRFMEKSSNTRVGHIPRVLYHWRERKESVAFAIGSKNYAAVAARNAKEDYIRRNGVNAFLEYIDGMAQYRMVYRVTGDPLVSIIIPSKDHPQILRQCITSIGEYTAYKNYEIVVVDNGSSAENRAEIEKLIAGVGGKYVYQKADFNFSAMCNAGAKAARGDFYLFLNDDIEIFQPQWLERMLGHAQQKHTGAVGAKLFYPNTTRIQHTGVSNPENGPLHSFMGLDDERPYYFGWNRTDCNCIGVTAACLMVDRSKFEEIGGFDEKLPVAYNDVKLCFALHEKGYYNVMRSDVFAYHHESLSRGSDHVDDAKLLRMSGERMGLFAEFRDLANRDPFMSPHLRQWSDRLELNVYFDEVTETDLSGCGDLELGCIDSVTVGDSIVITGWATLRNEFRIEELDRYVVLRDPFGRTYAARARASTRMDVALALGDERYVNAGFECVLKKEAVRMDIMPYFMGIMIVERDGTRRLCWYRESSVIRSPKPRPYALRSEEVSAPAPDSDVSDVCWYLDNCESRRGYHYISGFAFKRGDSHSRYNTTLLLCSADGRTIEFEVYRDERVDVAYTFPEEHFLYNTGFVCYVFDCIPGPGEYDVVIRLKNEFDPADVREISTGSKVRI